MLSIHCNKCEQLLGSSFLFCFLDNNNNNTNNINSRFIELTSRGNQETLATLLNKLVQSHSNQNEFMCKKCLSPICCIIDGTLHFKNAANVYFRELVYGEFIILAREFLR